MQAEARRTVTEIRRLRRQSHAAATLQIEAITMAIKTSTQLLHSLNLLRNVVLSRAFDTLSLA